MNKLVVLKMDDQKIKIQMAKGELGIVAVKTKCIQEANFLTDK